MGRSRVATFVAALSLATGLLVTGQAAAQSAPPPPEHYTRDARGVDLATGQFTYATAEVAIGSGVGGLVHARARVGSFWYDLGVGRADCDTSGCAIIVQGRTEYFTGFVTYTPTENTGSTLTYNLGTGIYEYRPADGTIYRFDESIWNPTLVGAALTQRIDANGLVTDYSFLSQQECTVWDEEGRCIGTSPAFRLQSYGNTAGYRLHYEYAGNDVNADSNAFYQVQKVTGFNGAVDYCAPTATSCSFSRVWPSVTYSVEPDTPSAVVEVATDELNRQTRYYVQYAGAAILRGIRMPGSTVNDVELDYVGTDLVSQVTDATGVWSYDYAVDGGVLTTTVTGPMSQALTVKTDLTIGRAVSVTDALENEWTYAYIDGRLVQAIAPEGNLTYWTYDARGNVTQVQYRDKGDQNTIATSATYPTSCVANVACNAPLTTTDPLGRVTDYDWDEDHGGLLSVTAPAPASGQPRPQTRYAYAAQTAYFKSSSGTIVAAPSSVILPTQVSACATAAATTGCTGTADEVRTAVTYGNPGVANNLLPTQMASGSGTVPNMSVTAMTYTPNGDVATVDGPLSGTGDLTQYLYDDGRQLVGVVGPDPDGAGALKNRAQRMTYNPRGQVTLAEQGATPGYTDPDWAAFAVLQKVFQAYDVWGRATRSEMQAANGTVYGLAQVSYDAAGRPECQVVRMNPAVFGTVTSNACVLGTQAGFGPDRIGRTTYDVLSRPVTTTTAYGLPEAITESVTYTANGQPQSLTDGEGNVSILEYDGFDRAARLRYPNANGTGTSTTDFDAWTYDDASNVLSEARRGTTITYDYDNLDRLVEVVAPSVLTRTYAYDNLGRTTSAVAGGVLNQTFVWDALGRPTRELSSGGGWVTSEYDAAGRRTRLTWPDYWYVDYDWDVYDGLLKVRQQGATSGPGVLATYAYDDLGRRASATLGNGATASYGWDAVSRLSSIGFNAAGTIDDLTLSYAHDPSGSIVQRTLSDSDYAYAPATNATAYTNDGLNRVTSAGGTAVTYDGKQNAVTAPGTPTLTFDGLNQMSDVGGTFLGYDALGRLRQTGAASAKISYDYDGIQLIQEMDNTGVILNRHVPGAGLDDVVASVTGAGARAWLMADERGSVMALSDAAGAVTQVNAWDEYGVPRPGNAGRFQYTGQMWLPFANLQHSRARAYDPSLGRFRQTDPIGYAAGANMYGYVGGDPVNWVDPLGLDPDEIRYQCGWRIRETGNPNSIDLEISRLPRWCYWDADGLNRYFPGGDFDGFAPVTSGGSVTVIPYPQCPAGPYTRLAVGYAGSEARGGRGNTGGAALGLQFNGRSWRGMQLFANDRFGSGFATGAGATMGPELSGTITNGPMQTGSSWGGSIFTEVVTPVGSASYAYGGSGREASISGDARVRANQFGGGAYLLRGAQVESTIASEPWGCR